MPNSGKVGGIIPPNLIEEDSTEASPHLPGAFHARHGSHGSLGNSGSGTSLIDIIPEEEREDADEDDKGDAAVKAEEAGDDFKVGPASRTTPPMPPPRATPAGMFGASLEKYAPVPWNAYFEESKDVPIPGTNNVFHVYSAGKDGPVVFCLHGGGYSGLSFAMAAALMKERVRMVAMDMRGHGLTKTSDDSDLSVETLCADVAAVVGALFGSEPPAIVLVGHSMGGAIAVRTAAMLALPTLVGLVVVDVVEGTAMASLVHMQALLVGRPSHFPSLEKGVEWSLRGGSLRNPDSARVSVPTTLRLEESGRYTWRTKLEDSQAHWKGWYDGLSETFLHCPVPKLLLLAGTDRLDKALTIAQMQGKFQMLVIRHSGHAIQEDEPEEFANSVLAFINRNRIGAYGVEIPGLRRH